MPPAVTKQQPPRTAAPAAPNGSILSTAVPVTELREKYVKIAIYGRNRVGKTTLACQFPKPLLLVAMEPTETGGAISVSRMDGVHVIQVAAKPLTINGKRENVCGSRKALMLADELSRSNPYATVVLDTCTAYQDIILTELMGLSAVPEQLNWGLVGEDQYRERSEKTREALRPFLDLKCHVVVVAQERDHNPDRDRGKSKLTRTMQQESFMAADLGGATVKWLHDACGYIVQLYEDRKIEIRNEKVSIGGVMTDNVVEVDTGKRVRRLRTLYHANFAAGFRSPTPDAVPEYIEAETPFEMYTEMMKVVNGVKSAKGKY